MTPAPNKWSETYLMISDKYSEETRLEFQRNFKPEFGDLVLNHWAAETNPHRISFFIEIARGGYRMTNGKGEFWTNLGHDHRLEVIKKSNWDLTCNL